MTMMWWLRAVFSMAIVLSNSACKPSDGASMVTVTPEMLNFTDRDSLIEAKIAGIARFESVGECFSEPCYWRLGDQAAMTRSVFLARVTWDEVIWVWIPHDDSGTQRKRLVT
jgi:hypothetical protein